MSDSDDLQAYLIELGPCDPVVVAAKTPMEAVDHALAKWNADDARGGSDPLTHRDLERLEALGPFEGIAAQELPLELRAPDTTRRDANGVERMIEDASRQLVEALRALGVKVR